MSRIYQAIMCGGEGKRLWPLSRRSLPKYYIPLADGESLFQKAFRRALYTSAIEDILLITTEINKHNALKQARFIIPNFPSENLIIRPEGKETFATLACALGVMMDRGAVGDEILICAPADHVINNTEEYKKTLSSACSLAQQSLVVIGIEPTAPSSDFGYIEYENIKPQSNLHYKVKRFTEKPDINKAKEFISQGNYLWNAGFYIGSFGVYINEIKKVEPLAADMIMRGLEAISQDFDKLPDSSIDYVVSEKTKQMLVVPATFDWDDYGDLESFISAQKLNQQQAIFNGENITAYTKQKLVVSVGVSNLTIVDTRDALLIADKKSTGGLSKIVNELKNLKLAAVDHHHTSYRPWGVHEVIEEGLGYKVNKLTIDPGCSSSTQIHHKRSEHWVVVSGMAKVTLNDKVQLIHTNESLYIPIHNKHRIENPTTEPLILIEIQTGTNIEEDDIIREEDPYTKEHATKI